MKMKTIGSALLIIAAAILFALPPAHAQEQPLSKHEKAQLFRRGAKLWPVYCGRCHKDRSSAEFSPAEWDTIMMHMRSVSEMPAGDARALLQYLKAGH